MIRLSSDWTLFYKFFLPTVWISFFGVVAGVIIFNARHHIPLIAGVVVFYLSGVALLAFTLMRLKRVEGTADHLYITNYFKTYRYTFQSFSKIRETDMFLFRVVSLHFHEKSAFGKKVTFLRRRTVWNEYLSVHPPLGDLMKAKTK